jgi:tetratricopeptide (TPR) repeat protein
MTGYLSTEKVQKTALLSNFTPSIMAPQVLEDILVQRHELVADLVDRIALSITTENKHFPLLIGARGMGKTHLVSIVYNRIKQREDLQERVIIAWLREEEWGISSWLDLVVRIFRSIGEEYPDTEVSSIAINNITTLQSHSPTEAEVLAESLLAELVGKKTLFLIIENLDDVFDGMGTNGQQRLRSFLQEYKCCTILATTPVLFNGITKRDEAFYGWFTPFHLQPLTHENAIELLTNIAAQSGDKELASFLHTPAGSARVRAVHRLAGGNPRVYTLFAQLITKQDLDSLVGAFMKMLDDLMPYYQSRMAMLSPQQRKIVAYLVDNTEAVIVKDIATWCFATPQTISSQLKDLKGKGYVVSSSIGKESYYELTEVLMRLCLEVKKYRGKEVESLVEMIRIWYRPEEIKAQFDRLISSGNSAHAQYYKLALEDSRPHPMLLAYDRDFQKSLERGDAKLVLQVWEELAHVQNISLDNSQKISHLIIAKKFDKASTVIRELLDNESIENLYLQGLILYELEAWNSALAIFNKIIINSNVHKYWLLYSKCLQKTEQYDLAVDSFRRAVEIEPEDHDSLYKLANLLNSLKRHVEAIEIYDRAVEVQPNNDKNWFNRGNAFLAIGKYQDAIQSYNLSIDCRPDKYVAWINKSIAFNGLKDYGSALNSLEKALELNPDEKSKSILLINKASVLRRLDKFQESIRDYKIALSINPNSCEALNGLGNSLQEVGEYNESIDYYIKALELCSEKEEQTRISILYNLGRTHVKSGNYVEAIKYFDVVLESQNQSHNHNALHNKGWAMYKCNNYCESIKYYDLAIDVQSDNYTDWHDKALVLLAMNQHIESFRCLEKAFEFGIKYGFKPYSIEVLIQELLNEQLLAKFQQPAVRDLMPQLIKIYTDAEVLPELGVALTRNLQALMSPIISDYTANEWLKLWQELGKPHPELGLALKMLAAGVKYKQNPQDKRIFLALPQELRPLVREALGLDGESSG